MDNDAPGTHIARRPLHFLWIADCSGSMRGDKIEALNNAIRESLPEMRHEAAKNANAQVYVRAIKFSTGAQWHVPNETPAEQFQWNDLTAQGHTDLGAALTLVTEALDESKMPTRGLRPVLVLISDGQPTDDYKHALRRLLEIPWGAKAVRIAVAIGQDADRDVLRRFINNPEFEPLEANNAEQLVRQIRWASTSFIKASDTPEDRVQTQAEGGAEVTADPVRSEQAVDIPVAIEADEESHDAADEEVW